MWYFIMACVKYGPVYTQHQNLLDQIDVSEKDEWAKTCAPEEVAMAYSHREFAENEFSQGDLHRAEDHLNRANANIAIAIEKYQTPGPCSSCRRLNRSCQVCSQRSIPSHSSPSRRQGH